MALNVGTGQQAAQAAHAQSSSLQADRDNTGQIEIQDQDNSIMVIVEPGDSVSLSPALMPEMRVDLTQLRIRGTLAGQTYRLMFWV